MGMGQFEAFRQTPPPYCARKTKELDERGFTVSLSFGYFQNVKKAYGIG
jgi:hypothetical protein